MKIFFDGKFVDEDKALISVKTHALNYGTGVFEGIRAYYSEKENALIIFRAEDHFKRMERSATLMSIKLPYSVKELCQITQELIKRNFQKTDLYIRPIAFKADTMVGNFDLKSLKDSLAIFCVPLGRHYVDHAGVRAHLSSWERVSGKAIPPRAKITGSYANTCLAKTESSALGYGEAIFLDRDENVLEGSAENIFMVKEGVVLTTPATSDILEGITRDTVMTICREDLKIEVKEKVISKQELLNADEVFLTGTGAEIAGIIEIDSQKIGDGKSGEITEKIKQIYSQLVHGEYPKHKNFLTNVTPD